MTDYPTNEGDIGDLYPSIRLQSLDCLECHNITKVEQLCQLTSEKLFQILGKRKKNYRNIVATLNKKNIKHNFDPEPPDISKMGTMTKPSYLRATAADIPQLMKLDRECFNRDFDNNFTEREYEEFFKKPGETGLITLNEATVGYYTWIDLNENEAEIVTLAVLPEYQNRGIGTKCLKMMMQTLKDRRRLKIVTHPLNLVALKLYLGRGFVISGFVEDYYGPGQPRVILHKTNR